MDYPTRPKLRAVIPYGYEVSPKDPKLLIPIPSELDLLNHVYDLMDQKIIGSPFGSRWLTAVTGRSISQRGLLKKYKHERKKE